MELAEYYSDNEHDFICSPAGTEGMTKCSNLSPFVQDRLPCNRSATAFSDNAPTNTSCVDWHVYYTDCRPSQHNPFQGAISFDNIGLAWVAIFQVRTAACSLRNVRCLQGGEWRQTASVLYHGDFMTTRGDILKLMFQHLYSVGCVKDHSLVWSVHKMSPASLAVQASTNATI